MTDLSDWEEEQNRWEANIENTVRDVFDAITQTPYGAISVISDITYLVTQLGDKAERAKALEEVVDHVWACLCREYDDVPEQVIVKATANAFPVERPLNENRNPYFCEERSSLEPEQ